MKKKILFITDEIYATSGVANVSKDIVYGLADEYDFFIIGGLTKSPLHGKQFDFSERIKQETGIECNVKEVVYNGFGERGLFEQILREHDIDVILVMNDIRHHTNFFNCYDLFTDIPKIFYYVWDSHLIPYYNHPYLNTFDSIMGISKSSTDGAKEILKNELNEKIIKYIPHGIDETIFYKDDDVEKFKNRFIPNEYDFIIGFNSVNIPRKRLPTLIEAYVMLRDKNPNRKIGLFIHTNIRGESGDLGEFINGIAKKYKKDIIQVSDVWNTDALRKFYNTIDVLCQPSSEEGFGLTICEAIMCEKMIVATHTGGIKDQLNDSKGNWCIPLTNVTSVISTSEIVPYIYADYVKASDVTYALNEVLNLSVEERNMCGKCGREYLLNEGFTTKNMTNSIKKVVKDTIDNFTEKNTWRMTKI